jgi:hypothetical protein
MRPIDRRECEALGRSPKDALRSGLRCSLSAFTGIADEIPLCMFGVVPMGLLGHSSGRVWFLARDGIERQARALLTVGRWAISEWLETFERLENEVSAENAWAIRLLKHWGFTVGDDVRMHGGVAFMPFHMERAIQAEQVAA